MNTNIEKNNNGQNTRNEETLAAIMAHLKLLTLEDLRLIYQLVRKLARK